MTREATILLCVGATKAGTSWLFEHLATHPECHLRGIKELHYFDAVESRTYGRQLKLQQARAETVALRSLAARGAEAERLARKARDVADWIAVLQRRTEDLPAYLGYLVAGRGQKRLVADITPAYSLLPVERLRRMAGMAGDVRFVYLLRDPVSRLWSQVRMMAKRASASADAIPEAAFAVLERILDGETNSATLRGDYIGALTRLRAAVAPERLKVMFQEEMLTAPGLARLCAFLGICPQPAEFDRRVHSGVRLEMTEDQRARAFALLKPQYDFVAREFPALPDSWRRNMGEVHG